MMTLLAMLVPIIVIQPDTSQPPIIYSDNVVVERFPTRPPIIDSTDIVVETCPAPFTWNYGCKPPSADGDEEEFYRWLGIER